MTTIAIPDHSVVVAIGGKRSPIAELLDRVDAPAVPWDVNKPKEAEAALHAALSAMPRARVAMARAHEKALKQVASIARRHGCATVVLVLPGADLVRVYPDRAIVRDVAVPLDVTFTAAPMKADLREITGPFDIIGDVHGCRVELEELLTELGHMRNGIPVRHRDGRIPVFVGDLTDRGPDSRGVLELVRAITGIGGLLVLGNHCHTLRRWLQGNDVKVGPGLATTVAELADTDAAWRRDMAEWLGEIPHHLVLDGGRLVVAHAGLEERHHGRSTPGAEAFALYGKAKGDGSVNAEGFPEAEDWALDYEGAATVVHGHVVLPDVRLVANRAGGQVWDVDTGCVFGGMLSALRYPERTIVQVAAKATWADPSSRRMTDQE